jgi:hypothetical protein
MASKPEEIPEWKNLKLKANCIGIYEKPILVGISLNYRFEFILLLS